MPFVAVSVIQTMNAEGNFKPELRAFFNSCGLHHYCGSITFDDASHRSRTVPIFNDECLGEKPETLALVKMVRKMMRGSLGKHPAGVPGGGGRSIHQNESGYLPYQRPATGTSYKASPGHEVAAPALRSIALIDGKLPNNQTSKKSQTLGEFLEITCGDGMHVEARLVVDYRFGIIYITLGHYHPDSFALLIRNDVELNFDIKPVLPALGATFSQ